MDLKEFGKLLKEERLRQGLELSEVMEKTKISRISLEAIEQGDSRALPHPVYAKGFVKNYARFLGLDADKMGNTMAQIYTSDEEESEEEHIALVDARKLPAVRSHWPLHMGLLALLAILILLALGAWHFRAPLQDGFFSLLEKTGIVVPRRVPAVSPAPGPVFGPQVFGAHGDDARSAPADRTSPEPVSGPASDAPGESATGPGAYLQTETDAQPDGGEAPGASPDKADESVPALSPPTGDEGGGDDVSARPVTDADLSVSAPREGASPASTDATGESAADRSSESAAVPARSDVPAAPATGLRSLEIKARQNCWLSTQADGGQIKEAFLRPDERLVVSFEKSMELKLGNAGGVDLFFDGRPWPLQANSGEVLVLRFP